MLFVRATISDLYSDIDSNDQALLHLWLADQRGNRGAVGAPQGFTDEPLTAALSPKQIIELREALAIALDALDRRWKRETGMYS